MQWLLVSSCCASVGDLTELLEFPVNDFLVELLEITAVGNLYFWRRYKVNYDENKDSNGHGAEDSRDIMSRLVYTIRSKNIDSSIKELLVARAQSLSDQVVSVCQLLAAIHESAAGSEPKEGNPSATEEVARSGLASLLLAEERFSHQFNEYMEILYAKELGTRPKKDRT